MIMTQEVHEMDSAAIITTNNNTSDGTKIMMAEAEHEEGEILEDGEIADDEEFINHSGLSNNSDNMTIIKELEGSKENDKNNIKNGANSNKFGPPFSNAGFDRDETTGFFSKGPKRKKRPDRSKKRKRSNSIESSSSKRKFSSSTSPQHEPITSQRDLIDISQYLNDLSFDNVELSDENEFNFELIEFDVFMEILGCKIDENNENLTILNQNVPSQEKSSLMCRIVKIMKQLHGNDPDTARRFARLKRRSREKQSSMNIGNGDGGANNKNFYKVACRFYLEGKCHKGSDCLYSHDVPIPKRKELCKFYLQGFCGKGDDCLFMHSEFPCKFFHTNTKCYAGEKCRFSHQPLTEESREILRSYLDSGLFPDEVKPYRPINHANDWIKDADDPDSNDYDYEALLSSKTRPVLLGPPTDKMKKSIDTWKWQQELKEAEVSYTGVKRNLFSIDDGLVISEKPPTPRIEDDEDEIEAHIQSYYNDLLDTDDYDEMIHAKEIEELEQKLKNEEAKRQQSERSTAKPPELLNPQPPITEMSEEEKRLIEASALDEDLRILPSQPFTLPSAFQNAAPGPQPPTMAPVVPTPVLCSTITAASPVLVSQTPSYNSFNSPRHNSFAPDIAGQIHIESNPVAPVSSFGVPPIVPNNNLEPAPINPIMAPTVPPAIVTQPTQSQVVPRDPRIRDPRLNNTNRLVPTPNTTPVTSSPSNSSISSTNSLSTQKSEIKVIKSNPNLVIKYRLFLVKVEPIDYSTYYDLYQNDNSLKNDPRLKRFFTNPPINTNDSDLDTKPPTTTTKTETDFFSAVKASNENLMTLPSLTILGTTPQKSSISSSQAITLKPTTIESSPLQSSSSTTTNNKNDTSATSKNRDPRMRNRDMDHRNSIDNKNSDSNTSIISTSSTDQTTNNWDNSKQQNSPERNDKNSISNNNNETDRTSIPSYALSALPPTTSLFSSVTGNNILFSTGADKLLNQNNEKSKNISDKNQDDDDEEDEDQLKVDENHVESSAESTIEPELFNENDNSSNQAIDDSISKIGTLWPSNVISNNTGGFNTVIDSDNEMEIDLHASGGDGSGEHQNQNNSSNNNESESEYENELIIATSSSETEDNTKDSYSNNTNISDNTINIINQSQQKKEKNRENQ